MNLYEFKDLTKWIDKEIVNNAIPKKYTNLINVVSQNVNQKNGQPLQPFEEQKNILIETLNKQNINNLSKEQLNIIDKVGFSKAIGKTAAVIIEELFYKKGLDLATVLTELQKMNGMISTAITRNDQFKQSLQGILEETENEFLDEEAIIKIHFQNETSINNIVEFKKMSTELFDIMRGLAFARDMAPENIRVVSAEKGSIILTLGVAIPLVSMISKAILRILEIAEKALEIKKKAEEIKNLKLSNEKIEKELLKESEDFEEKEKKKLVEELRKEFCKKADGEKDSAMLLSLNKLLYFIEKGGEVDCFLPYSETDLENEKVENPDDSEQLDLSEYREISNNFNEIRALERKIKLIEEKIEETSP